MTDKFTPRMRKALMDADQQLLGQSSEPGAWADIFDRAEQILAQADEPVWIDAGTTVLHLTPDDSYRGRTAIASAYGKMFIRYSGEKAETASVLPLSQLVTLGGKRIAGVRQSEFTEAQVREIARLMSATWLDEAKKNNWSDLRICADDAELLDLAIAKVRAEPKP